MRQLEKGVEPTYLAANAVSLTDQYAAAVLAGVSPLPRVWRHKDIRAALESETSGRCAYCEGEISAVSYGRIEHFRPRASFPGLVVDWRNLTLACERCNGAKLDKWSDELPFVSPYEDVLDEHLAFAGPLVFGVTSRGKFTVRELQLDRLDVVEARERQIKGVLELYANWLRAIPAARVVHEAEIEQFVADTPYSTAVKAALRGFGYPNTV